MKVKRFFAKTMQEALRSVKEQMGEDAVILSNKKVDGGVEIVTALNYDETLVKTRWQRSDINSPKLSSGQLAAKQAEHQVRLEKEMERARSRIEQVRMSGKNHSEEKSLSLDERLRSVASASKEGMDNYSATENINGNENLDVMKAEILQLRKALHHHNCYSFTDEQGRKSSLVQQQLTEQLDEMGIDNVLIKRIVGVVDQDKDIKHVWKQALNELSKTLVTEADELIHKGGVFALVGPTGSGKTTTIGKLAARYVLEFDATSIALVTTDRYRVAAHEQLKVFGRILNIPVSVVNEQNCLDDILEGLSDKKLVLIDTAGLSHQDHHWLEQMMEIQNAKVRINRYLVLPATTQSQIMKSNYHQYKKIGINGCVLTKLDEAVTLGESLSFLARTSLAIAYVTDGQKIPDDIHAISPKILVHRAIELYQNNDSFLEENGTVLLKKQQISDERVDVAG